MSKRPIPFEFVLENLARVQPMTKPMFGCLAVYLGEKIVLILREKQTAVRDNGVWLATSAEHHGSLKKEFPSMRSIELFGKGPTNWQNLPVDADDFEESAVRACELVLAGDPRIGRIPKRKSPRKSTRRTAGNKKRR